MGVLLAREPRHCEPRPRSSSRRAGGCELVAGIEDKVLVSGPVDATANDRLCSRAGLDGAGTAGQRRRPTRSPRWTFPASSPMRRLPRREGLDASGSAPIRRRRAEPFTAPDAGTTRPQRRRAGGRNSRRHGPAAVPVLRRLRHRHDRAAEVGIRARDRRRGNDGLLPAGVHVAAAVVARRGAFASSGTPQVDPRPEPWAPCSRSSGSRSISASTWIAWRTRPSPPSPRSSASGRARSWSSTSCSSRAVRRTSIRSSAWTAARCARSRFPRCPFASGRAS